MEPWGGRWDRTRVGVRWDGTMGGGGGGEGGGGGTEPGWEQGGMEPEWE